MVLAVEDERGLLSSASSESVPSVQTFEAIRTLPAVFILSATDLALLVAAFALPATHQLDANTGRPSLFSLLLYMQCLLWVSASVFDVYAGMRHRRSRLRGYLEFERRVRPLVRAVPASVTGGSVVLLVTAAIVWDYCPADGGACSARVALTSVNYVQIVLSLQTAVLLPLCVAYAVRVWRFNASTPLPDIFEGRMVYDPSRSLPAFEDVGIRDGRPETLLDKQAEAIHFLRQHNARLSRKIMELQSLHDSPVRA